MASSSTGGDRRRNARSTPDLLATNTDSTTTTDRTPGKLELVQRALFSKFNQHRKSDSAKILSDLAPVIMTPRMMSSATTVNPNSRSRVGGESSSSTSSSSHIRALDFATLGRAPLRLGMGSRRITSRDLQIVEATEELLQSEVPEPDGVASNVSLLRGFNATIPSAELGKSRRRKMRNVDTPRIGLKKMGMSARGMLAEEQDQEGSEEDVVFVPRLEHGKKKGKRRGRESLSATKLLGKEELSRQTKEIQRDKENIHVRRSLINSEIDDITLKIEALDGIRAKLERDLLKLQEDELELDDELEGVKERLHYEQSAFTSSNPKGGHALPHATRRSRGPAFLPSEHDELPPGVAFMTLDSHTTPITALDFSEPYGTLVSASQEDTQPRVWDLMEGTEIGRLRGHTSTVKCIQVQDHVCLTGSEDSTVRMWDLRRVDEDEGEASSTASTWDEEGEIVNLNEEEDVRPNGIRNGVPSVSSSQRDEVCARVLEGHTKAVTALYFEDDCLVTGASDKTLRQWDLKTGQCVMTMDILWAMSHAPPTSMSNGLFSGAGAGVSSVGTFAVPTPPYADGSWELYQDFVGGVQFWGYGLVSGSGDAAVRMWDMRTGQSHRTLMGHTGPVTCLQFDELHIVSGSLDKTIRIWDLRTGGVFETLKYDYPVTSLQFDTRKVVAATGENGVKIYNRTSLQHSSLHTNGHTSPVERIRYMDKYLVSGARDATVKIWSL